MIPAGRRTRALALAVVLGLTGAMTLLDVPDRLQPSPGSVAGLPEPGGGMVTARLRGGVPAGAYARAISDAAAVPSSPLTLLQPWIQRGPTQTGGRITDLLLLDTPSDDHAPALLVATASGGVWRSEDGGRTLTPTWSDLLPPAIGALGMLADGTLLAGTGEANAGGGSTTFGGHGVFRSVDGGRSWTASGLPTSGTIARIIGHPSDPDVAWVAAGGDLFAGGGERGVYRTEDGGRRWTLVLPPDTPTTGGADLALDPADPDHLLASTWDRLRTPSQRRYGGPGSGLHQSRDGGRTWTQVTDGIPGFSDDAGRIAVALSPADPAIGYAVVTRGDGRGDGLYRSEDGGTSWRLVNRTQTFLASQFIFGWWFSKVFPAPDDPDRVIVPGLTLLESTDAGQTFALDTAVHADHHALVWDPSAPSRAWLGSDAGLYRSSGGGLTGTWVPAEEQPFTQAYAAAASPVTPDTVLGAFQDIGCQGVDGDAPWLNMAPCGDGVAVLPHPTHPGEAIVCGQYGRCWITSASGGTASLNIPVDRAAWLAPLVRLPGDADSLRFGGARVLASGDGGGRWRAISPDLTRGSSPDPDYAFGTITEILPVDPDGQDLLVGTDDGLLWRTTDGGTTWTKLIDGDRWVTGLAASHDGTVLIVGSSGFFAGEDTAQLRRSVDGGQSWEDLTDGLPDAPVNDVVVADGSLLAATDVGVFSTRRWLEGEQPAWRRVGAGLPQSPVLSLQHLSGHGLLTVGTFGRGVWQTYLPELRRVAGPDRFATAAAVLAASAGAGTQTVVLASGEGTADALAAAALVARQPGWGLLLTAADRLPQPTSDALAAAGPQRVIVVGGTAAVSDAVASAAAAAAGGAEVQRIAGDDRYATASALAAVDAGDGTLLLATAGTPFDALAGASLAAAIDAPLLLVDPQRLPAASAEALAMLAPSRIIALGGTAAIGEEVLQRAGQAASPDGPPPTLDRIAGVDRVETAALVAAAAATAVESGVDASEASGPPGNPGGADGLWLASVDGVTDALAAGATGWPVLLARPASLPTATGAAIASMRPRAVLLAGGEAVLGDPLLDILSIGPPLPAGG